MTAYDRLRADAVQVLESHLAKETGLSPTDVAKIVDALNGASLPGFMALLGKSKQPVDQTGHGILREAAVRAAQMPAIEQTHVNPADVERLLTAVFTHGASPNAVFADSGLRDVVLHAAVEQLANKARVPLTPAQANEAVQLLATGEFFNDAASALGAAAFAVHDLPIDLVKDVVNLPHRVPLVLPAVARDVASTPFVPFRVLEDLLDDGKLDHPPGVLRHTMAALLGFASLATTTHMLGELIRPENRSVRLALIVYARANGIPLEDADLDVLRNNVFATNRPDLGPVLVAAVDRYLDQRAPGQLVTALRQIAAARDGG
jgi:hypothetical protein